METNDPLYDAIQRYINVHKPGFLVGGYVCIVGVVSSNSDGMDWDDVLIVPKDQAPWTSEGLAERAQDYMLRPDVSVDEDQD